MKRNITNEELKKYGILLTEDNLKQFMKKQGALVDYENLNELEKDGIKYKYVSDIIERYAKNDYVIRDRREEARTNLYAAIAYSSCFFIWIWMLLA